MLPSNEHCRFKQHEKTECCSLLNGPYNGVTAEVKLEILQKIAEHPIPHENDKNNPFADLYEDEKDLKNNQIII